MINKEFLANCSDEQINAGVAWCEAVEMAIMKDFYEPVDYMRLNKHRIGFYNFCSSPNDIMPIAVRYGMGIEFPHIDRGYVGTVSIYIHGDEDISIDFTSGQNYLRAICEVYILMSVAK
jgi:hypothetical protein